MEATNEELWRVQLGTGEIRIMTLDGLDRAFNEGLIDARVPVLAPGASRWTTLAEAAGLEDDTPVEQTPSLSPFAVAAPSSTVSTLPEADDSPPLTDDFDFEELARGQRRARGLIIGGVVTAAAVFASLAIVATKLGAETPVDVKATSAAAAPLAAQPLPPPEVKETKPTLTDEQRQQLLEADKARDDNARAKNQEKAEKVERTRKKPAPKTNSVFVNGGDKFDPLNGAL